MGRARVHALKARDWRGEVKPNDCSAVAKPGANCQCPRDKLREHNMFSWVILALIVGVAGYAIVIYNSLVSNRQMVREGWSGIDVQLKRRTDLIPNLMETVKGYMAHERETLDAVINARARATSAAASGPAARAQAEGELSSALGRLLAVAEAYPDLKANTTFLEFQNALRGVEDEIQMARRYYNGAVRNLNIQVESFPSNFVANAFKFTQEEYFELENEAERAVPQVKF
jgi:LemA protein